MVETGVITRSCSFGSPRMKEWSPTTLATALSVDTTSSLISMPGSANV